MGVFCRLHPLLSLGSTNYKLLTIHGMNSGDDPYSNHHLRAFTDGYPLVMSNSSCGKSPVSMGKSTISTAIFNSELLVYQRVYHIPGSNPTWGYFGRPCYGGWAYGNIHFFRRGTTPRGIQARKDNHIYTIGIALE